jgi:hypothetical protein
MYLELVQKLEFSNHIAALVLQQAGNLSRGLGRISRNMEVNDSTAMGGVNKHICIKYQCIQKFPD